MSEFNDYLKELFQPFGEVVIRRMFGGQGVFYDGLMIGIVEDDTLYLKTDPITVGHFEAQELEQFTYAREGKKIGLSFYQAPGEAMDSPEDMTEWATLAYQAALRSKKQT